YTKMGRNLSARELGVGENHGGGFRKPVRQETTPKPLARPKPFRMRKKRDIVHGDGERHSEPERCGVGGSEEDVRFVSAHRTTQAGLFPPGARAYGIVQHLD